MGKFWDVCLNFQLWTTHHDINLLNGKFHDMHPSRTCNVVLPSHYRLYPFMLLYFEAIACTLNFLAKPRKNSYYNQQYYKAWYSGYLISNWKIELEKNINLNLVQYNFHICLFMQHFKCLTYDISKRQIQKLLLLAPKIQQRRKLYYTSQKSKFICLKSFKYQG